MQPHQLVGQRGRQAKANVLDISAEHQCKTWLLYSPGTKLHPELAFSPAAGSSLGIKLTRGLFSSVQLLLVQLLYGSFGAQAVGSATILGFLGAFFVSFLLPTLCPSRKISGWSCRTSWIGADIVRAAFHLHSLKAQLRHRIGHLSLSKSWLALVFYHL